MELFSAYAEVFPIEFSWLTVIPAFLCLRRGVSIQASGGSSPDSFSLPTQRCFPGSLRDRHIGSLFSAYAEVFPDQMPRRRPRRPFLCLRRGVSVYLDSKKDVGGFSLPTQRCFYPHEARRNRTRLFSAYAEVFLSPSG